MEIKLDVKVPNDNTNTPHGSVKLRTDRRYTYITTGDSTIVVDADEIYKSIVALYNK